MKSVEGVPDISKWKTRNALFFFPPPFNMCEGDLWSKMWLGENER